MKTLFLDVDDTLYLRSEPFIKACQEVLLPVIDIDFDKFYLERSYWSDVYLEDLDAGKISTEEMYELRLNKALEKYGFKLTRDQVLRFEDCYREKKEEILLDDRYERMLKKLKDNSVNMTIITNGNSINQRGKGRTLGIDKYISEEKWIISGEIGVNKPALGIFREAERIMDSKSEDCYIVGDNYDVDIAGGVNAGWHTIWFNHRHNEIKHYKPDYEVYDIDGLVELIEELFLRSTNEN